MAVVAGTHPAGAAAVQTDSQSPPPSAVRGDRRPGQHCSHSRDTQGWRHGVTVHCSVQREYWPLQSRHGAVPGHTGVETWGDSVQREDWPLQSRHGAVPSGLYFLAGFYVSLGKQSQLRMV